MPYTSMSHSKAEVFQPCPSSSSFRDHPRVLSVPYIQKRIMELIDRVKHSEFEATRGNVVRVLMGNELPQGVSLPPEFESFRGSCSSCVRSQMMLALAKLIRSKVAVTQPHPKTSTPVLQPHSSDWPNSLLKLEQKEKASTNTCSPPKQPPLKRSHLQDLTNSPNLSNRPLPFSLNPGVVHKSTGEGNVEKSVQRSLGSDFNANSRNSSTVSLQSLLGKPARTTPQVFDESIPSRKVPLKMRAKFSLSFLNVTANSTTAPHHGNVQARASSNGTSNQKESLTAMMSHRHSKPNGDALKRNLSRVSKPVTKRLSDDVKLNAEQAHLVKLVMEGKSVFFTGSAGTGKSLVLRNIIESLTSKTGYNGKVFVTAPTGIAACNVGGQTLHSFAGIGLGRESKEKLASSISSKPFLVKRWRAVKVLIIDEVSMLDNVLFDKLEFIARKVRKKEKPFGGIQLVLAGDFFQLPPVGLSRDNGKTGVQFCFKSPVWNQVVEENVVLKKIYRQQDQELINVLNNLRLGVVSDETIRKFQTGFKHESDGQTNQENGETNELGDAGRVGVVFNENASSGVSEPIEHTRLYTKNVNVDRLNHMKLNEVVKSQPFQPTSNPKLFKHPGQPSTAAAQKSLGKQSTPHVYKAHDWSAHAHKLKLLNQGQIPESIKLGIGAQVMLLTNRMKDGLVNGSRGVVIGFQKSSHQERQNSHFSAKFYSMTDPHELLPVVQFADSFTANGKRIRRKPRVIGRVEQTIMEGDKCVALRAQVPLKLAWALSIHKSQGMTIDRLIVDLSGAFEYGQAYVALSRASSLAGLQVVDFSRRCVKVHPDVIEFYQRLENEH